MGLKVNFKLTIMHLECFWIRRTSEDNSQEKAAGQAGQDKHLLKIEQKCKARARTVVIIMC